MANANSSNQVTAHLIIDTGRENKMFTLWRVIRFPEYRWNQNGAMTTRYHYMQNIGHTAEIAQAKAEEIAKRLNIELRDCAEGDLRDIRKGKRNPVGLVIGKYAEKTIDEVFEIDAPYLKWYADAEPAKSRHHAQFFNVLNDFIESKREEFNEKRDLGKDDRVIYAGKHEGTRIEDLPKGYLDWLAGVDMECNHTRFKGNVIEYLEENHRLVAGEFQGEIGKRIEVELTTENVHYFETDYGTSAIVTMKDKNENTYLYMGTGDFPNKGETALVRGTVKDHKEYEGINQTKLVRLYITELNPAS